MRCAVKSEPDWEILKPTPFAIQSNLKFLTCHEMNPVNFEFHHLNYKYEVTHTGYDLDDFVFKWDGYVQ